MKSLASLGKRKRRNKYGKKHRRCFVEARWRSPAFEVLEERAMLSVATDLVGQLTPYQTALNTRLDASTLLPLVGHQLADLQEFDTIFQDSLQSIDTQTQGITNSGHYQLTVPLPSLARTFTFDLGLDAFLRASVAGGVSAAINPTLVVGFDYQNGSAVLDAVQTSLDLGFNLSLLPNFQATMSFNNSLLFPNGLLFARADDDAGTNFQGNLGFDFNAGAGLTPHFSGEAHVTMGLSLSFADPAEDVSFNPTFRTTLDLDWGFDTNNQLMAPTIQLQNFGLDVASFMDGVLGDIVKTVQKFTKPIQPFIDIFQTPVPIISAFGSDETIGSLLLKGAGSSQAQQDSFTLMIQIIDAVNAFDLSGDTGGAVIPFGTITLTGNAQTPGAFGFDTSQVGGAIDDIFGSPALQEVKDALNSVSDFTDMSSSAGFKFQLLENPGPVVGAILTGQIATMFEFTTGRQHFELSPSIGVGIPGVLGIFLSAGVVFDANLTMGYDTAGLIAFAADPNNPAHLLHGFYFDNSIDFSVPPRPNLPPIRKTGLYFDGHMKLEGDVLFVEITGGLYATVSVELVNTAPATDHVALDVMIGNLTGGAPVFDLSGKVFASADITLEISLPIGPDITLFEYNLGYVELVNFDLPPPPTTTPPPVIHDDTNEQTLLLEVARMGFNSRVTVQPFHNLPINHNGSIYEGDGIRVDYPGETHLFIERKDNVPYNFYNLIALDGTPPDQVAINVIDPFRVFVDEGVIINPYPAQTKPAVILAGGKDVVYSYAEAADGTKPNVLLVGGFGSNTLTGGTMEFGNFLPSSRVAQAHAHFADISGFDAVGQSLIGQQIANAVPPSTPSGIIGATMSASRGGLMMGGPGNNSFYATGAGDYEMVGGNWLNSFDISPSYRGAPATYQIDGGGGASKLVVRVPGDENVIFENSTIVDKYTPTLKALDVLANAGLSATAHGIQKVHIVAAAGSSIELGDTSEVDIQFSIAGSAHLKFGGSPAPDDFSVVAQYAYNGRANRYNVPALEPFDNTGYSGSHDFDNGIQDFTVRSLDSFYGRHDGPVYTIVRTFGTNGKTQSIPFAVGDSNSSSITLDGKGASDDYDIGLGIGTFFDITVEDSDAATQNSLTVDYQQAYLLSHRATLTDSSLKLEYFTPIILFPVTFTTQVTHFYTASATYSPSVHFGANVDIAFVATGPFQQLIVNRPNAPQRASILFDGIYTVPGGGGQAFPTNFAYDPYTPGSTLLTIGPNDPTYGTINVQANGGNLSITNTAYVAQKTIVNVYANTGLFTISGSSAWIGEIDTVNVFDNAGTLNINHTIVDAPFSQGYVPGLYHTVNVLGNAGIINLRDVAAPHLIAYFADAQANLGNNGSLANVHGAVNFSNSNSRYGLTIDDRNSAGASRPWTIGSATTQIGDLTLNYPGVNAPAPYLDIFSKYQAFPKVGSSVTLGSDPPFYTREINGGSFPSWQLSAPSYLFNQDGNVVNVSLVVSGDPGGPITYGAINLPPGLSINPTTGVISGTIPEQAYRVDPYETTVTASAGAMTRSRNIFWYVSSAIEISAPIFGTLLGHEGMAASLGPITTTNSYNRPVTLTVTGLPQGLSFDPGTASIGGVIDVGAAQNAPYHVTVQATDGAETANYEFDWAVTGITLVTPPLQNNLVGNSVNLAIQATTASGGSLTYAADGLPDGLSIDPATGVISGVVASQPQASSFNISLTATQGNDVASTYFRWSVVPVGLSDVVTIVNPGTQTDREEDYAFSYLYASSSLGLPLSLSVQGLPPGLSFFTGGSDYISGQIEVGAASASPYHVTLTATDGTWSDDVTFDWIVSPAGTVDVYNLGTQTSLVNDIVEFPMYATSSLSEALTYSATGLPLGLSIHSQTGVISGVVSPLAALPSVFQVSVSATSASDVDRTTFLWNVLSSYQPNVISLPNPVGVGVIDIMSPIGTQLSASISTDAGVALPDGAMFPFGFVTFAIRNLAPGAAADITIVGLDPAQITDYYKYGATPANPNNHWYDFLFGQQTDGDSAVGTGMEIVGGNIVLHLVDGGRGDDDVALNGVIFDIGGPAVSQSPLLPGDYNLSGVVDAADYTVWRNTLGQTGLIPYSGADGDGDGQVDTDDYQVWKANFGNTSAGPGSAAIAATVPSAPVVREQAVRAESVTPASKTVVEPVAGKVRLLSSQTAAVIQTVTLRNKGLHLARRDRPLVAASHDNAIVAWLTAKSAGLRRELAVVDLADARSEPDSPDTTGQLENALDLAFESLAV